MTILGTSEYGLLKLFKLLLKSATVNVEARVSNRHRRLILRGGYPEACKGSGFDSPYITKRGLVKVTQRK